MAHMFKAGDRYNGPTFSGTVNHVYPPQRNGTGADRQLAVVWCDDGVTRHVLAPREREAPHTKCDYCGNDDTRQMVDNGENPHAPTYELMCKRCKHIWFVN
jgi:hypothetical protein